MAVIGAGGCTGVPGASSSAQAQSFWPQPSVRDTVAAAVQPVRDTDNLIPQDYSPLVGGGGNAGDGSGVGTLLTGKGKTWLPASPGPPLPAVPSYSSGQPAGVRVVLQRTGSAQSTAVVVAVAPTAPAVVYPLQSPVAAKGRGLPPRGRTQGRSGTFTAAAQNAPFYPLNRPARAHPQPPTRGACRTNISVAISLSGPPVYPLGHPVRTVPQPPPRGRAQGRSGVYTATGPTLATFYPLNRPAAAVTRPPAARGRTRSSSGVYDQVGPQFYPLRHPVAAVIRPLAARGRTYSRAGIFNQLGPVFRPFLRPVAAIIRPLPIRGRSQSLAGQQQGTGAPLTQLRRPVQARFPLPVRGRAQGRAGVYTSPSQVQAVFYPLDRPAGAVVRPQPIRGRTSGRNGTFDHLGPAFYPLNHPVQARRPLPPRGTAQWRYGTFSPITSGSPFYPFRRPVAAVVRPLPPRGQVRSNPGTAQGTGAPLVQLRRPVAAIIRVLAPRGRSAGRAGTYQGAGPAVTPLQRPVRAHPALPPRGTTQGRSGVSAATPATAPFYPLNHPVQARQPLPRRGVTRGNPGVFGQAGPPVTPLRGPVRASVRQFGPRGRAQGHPGVFAGSGPPVKPLQHPVYAWRPGPRRGVCLTSVRPAPPVPYIEATFYPLRKPVQARRPLPPHGRTLTTPPYVPPGAAPANFVMTAWSPRATWETGPPQLATDWQAAASQLAWEAGDPFTTWEAGAPLTAWQDGSPSQT